VVPKSGTMEELTAEIVRSRSILFLLNNCVPRIFSPDASVIGTHLRVDVVPASLATSCFDDQTDP
jgi:hypothetical protein